MSGRLSRFARTQRGTAGLLFALAAIPMFALAGGVIDYVYVQNEKEKLQTAADAAVLAAMQERTAQEDEVRQIVTNYLQGNYRKAPRVHLNLNDLEVNVEHSGSTISRIRITIPAEVDTTFWSLVGVRKARLRIEAEATQGSAGLEVVMVLDSTGSMYGEKIEELKAAAGDLVDTLAELANDAQMETVKLGLVPYTFGVNVGTDKRDAPWLDMSQCCGNAEWNGWVGSRPEPDDITDGNYSVSPVPAIPSIAIAGDKIYGPYANIPPIVPLRELSDPAAVSELKSQLQDMEADGWTYIPAGLVWGWRVLSPQPPYTEGMDFDEAAERNVRKVVILMTDGSNTCHNPSSPVGGVPNIKECGYADHIVSHANERMRRLCRAMHDQGILIASVAYEVTDNTDAADTIRELMEECGNFGYYTPRQGELRDVFREIARRLAKLHLSR